MKPDPGLIFAVRRIQTGAHIHKINNWLHQYVLACHTENRKLADEARLELIAFTKANRKIRWRWDDNHGFETQVAPLKTKQSSSG